MFASNYYIGPVKNQKIKYYDFYNSFNLLGFPFEPYKVESCNKKIYKICIIAGVHGNEPAGTVCLKNLISNGYFTDVAKKKRFYIRVIPCVNEYGYKNNIRYQSNMIFPDINRNFKGEGDETTSKTLLELIKDFDLVIDFHEGWGFHLINNKSIGSTLSPSSKFTNYIAEECITELNKNITDIDKKFIVLNNRSCEIPTTLACNRKKSNKDYLLVETSGQNNIQPMHIRTEQIKTIIDTTLTICHNKLCLVN